MNVLGYAEDGSIRIEVDGVTKTVPAGSPTAEGQMIAEWEAAGNTIPPFASPDLSASDVDREHDRRAAIGKTFTVAGYGDVPLEGSLRTQTVLLALKDTARDMLAAGVTAPVLFFTDRDNGDHNLTPAQTIDLVDQGKAYMQALHEAKRLLKASPPIPADYADDSYWPPA